MKKLLVLLGVISLIATTGATVVACGPKDNTSDTTKTFALSSNTSSLEIGATASVTVTNFSDLTDLALKSSDETFAKATIVATTGEITIEGIANGSTTIKVSSTNAADITISVTIKDIILLSTSTLAVESDVVEVENSTLKVTNFE